MTENEQDFVQARADGQTETLKWCPECQTQNVESPLERLQLEEDKYWVRCTNQECCYLEEFLGKVVVPKEYLVLHGLPAQLLQYMDIYSEDVNKIVRICMAEYIKMKYSQSPAAVYDLKTVKELVNNFAGYHANSKCTLQETHSSVNFNERVKNHSKMEVINEHPCGSQDDTAQPQKVCSIYDDLKKLTEEVVEDLSSDYQERVKTAFSKIKGYNFPEQFAEDTSEDKLPLFKFVEEYERQDRMKVETDNSIESFFYQ